MKKFYLLLIVTAIILQVNAQTPVKKWQGASSNDWDEISANWIPVDGLPFPETFVNGDDILIDDSANEGKDTLNVIGEIEVANITFNNSEKTFYVTPNDETSKIMGSGAIYKENDGTAIIGVNVETEGGIVARNGYYAANDPDGAINAFGPKVIFEGGSIKINKEAVDNPTYSSNFEVVVSEGQTGEIIAPRRLNLQGKVSGSGTLILNSNGERDFIDLTGGADWTEFTGQCNIVKGDEETAYSSGFYGFLVQTDSTYAFEIDDSTGTGTITETGVNEMLENSKIHIGSGNIFGSWSGTRCYRIGELTTEDETVEIRGYAKTKSTTPYIIYQIGSANTDFTLSGHFTGQMGSGDGMRRYNQVGLIKVGTGTMRLTNPNNYITSLIVAKEGKLFISNPEGSNTGTGFLHEGVPLIVGPDGILGGTGSISRNVHVYGSLQPGEDAVGKLSIQDSLNVLDIDSLRTRFTVEMKPVGELQIELASVDSYDIIKADSFNTAGTLTVIPAATYDLKVGDTFKIIDGLFSVNSAGFDSISLPFTDNGWVWDTSNLEVDGTITLTSGGGSGTYDPEDPGSPDAIDKTSLSNSLKVYPNPSSGMLNIRLSQVKGNNIEVLNTAGTVVYKQPMYSNEVNLDLTNSVSDGLYIIRVNTDEGVISSKIMIRE